MPRTLLPHFLLLLLSLLHFSEGVSVMEVSSVRSGGLGAMGGMMEEDMMDSESNRRVLLMRRRYISYDTLRRDLVPCDRPGASYYNCKAPGMANSYNRGCEVITRCARGD